MKGGNKIIIWVALLLVAGAAGALARVVSQGGGLRQTVVGQIVKGLISTPKEINLVQRALGMERPRTYLVLFLNNTELRPGGGFIGAYAIVKMDKTNPSIIKVEGTEILDNRAPQNFPSEPPEPLKKYLKVARWNFRDSNWSPDFRVASEKALELYRKEKGVEAENIDAVVGFTPTVLEEVLKISGPIVLNGQEYTSENFTKKLEYEVEFGYAKQGLHFDDRKKALVDLTHLMLERLRFDVFKHWSEYMGILPRMLAEKQVAFYSKYPEEQSIIEAKQWAGALTSTGGDYLQWVDANLGALKTDAVIDRSLAYSLKQSGESYTAEATMRFTHKGVFDNFTTRYRDYARIFVPLGSKLVGVTGAMETDRSTKPGKVDQGEENGRQWFGAFISIEPGKIGQLSFHYELPAQTVENIKKNNYKLLVQKQMGTIAPQLTLRLDFGKPLVGAKPGENSDKHGDQTYDYQTDLRVDREFSVTTK